MNRNSKIFSVLKEIFSYSNSEKQFRAMFGFVSNNNLKGDYLEFGVFSGNSLMTAIHFSKFFKIKDINFYGFDSFEGMPQPVGIDKGLMSASDYSCDLEEVNRILKNNKCDMNKIFLIKGWFNNVKIPKEIKKASIINIDCDFYSSTKDVLKLIKPYLQEGTLIRFDDWGLYKGNPDKGQQGAFNNFKKNCKSFKFIEYFNDGFSRIFLTIRSNKK